MAWESLMAPATDTLFTTYMIAGVQVSLDRVRATASLVPEADRQQAWHILSFALDVAAAWPVTSELLLALAPKMEQAGFREEWIPYLEKGLHAAQKAGDHLTVAECALQIGTLYRLLSRFAEAQRWTTVSVEHFGSESIRPQSIVGQARALNELAWIEHLQHHYESAEQNVAKALSLPTTDERVRADAFRVKGMIQIGQRNWAQAKHFHQQALLLFQQVGDVRKVAWSMQNLGYALKELGSLDDASHYLQQAADILAQLQDYYHLAIVQMNLANVLVHQGQATLAYELLLTARQTFATQGNLLNQAHVLTNLGVVLIKRQLFTDAQAMFRAAADLYKNVGDQIWHINALDGLVMALTMNGQYADAVDLVDEAMALLPAIYQSAYYENLREKLTTHRAEAAAMMTVAT